MSLRAVEKALATSIADGKLQEDAINEYIDKFYPSDAAQSDRLQEDLVELYNANSQSRPPPAVLVEGIVRLIPVLTQPKILMRWFESLAPYAVDSSGVNNDLVAACRELIRTVLTNDDTKESAEKYIEWLLEIYVGKATKRWIPAGEDTMERLRFIRYNCRTIILEVFPRSIETCTHLLDGYVLDAKYRVISLQLLSECVSKCDQSKLFKIIDFDLLKTLFRCLEIDQSPIVLTIAATTLAMIMPHICDKLVPYLPRIYACYGRLCSWYVLDEEVPEPDNWQLMRASEDDTGPTAESMFMMLYGLFPNNTIAFCRDADNYLKKHNYSKPFDDFWNKPSIQRASEGLFSTFLLHPGLIQTTEEQELSSNTTRWQSYRSTVDIIMRCVDMHITNTESDNEEDEDVVKSLLQEHLRLFKTSMARSSASPLLGARSRSSSRAPSRAPSRTQSPVGMRTTPSLAPASPLLVSSISEASTVPPAAEMLSPARARRTSNLRSEIDDSATGRGRSKSQPPQPSPPPLSSSGLTPMTSAATVGISSPALPAVASGGSLDSGEFYLRELLLIRNELDFVNFNKYIVERKLVQLQKKLAQLDIANIRVDNLVHKNKQLKARLVLLEQEIEKAQKGARTLLKQRTSYEATILEKNKDLKQQVSSQMNEENERNEELARQRHQLEAAEALAQRRGGQVTELELTITRLETQIEEYKMQQQQLEETENSITNRYGNVTDDLNETDQSRVAHAKEILDAKIMRVELEGEGAVHDYETRIAHLESERNRLKQLVREQELKLESGMQSAAKFDATERKVAEIRAHVSHQYQTLRKAHDDLLKRYSETERELRVRRVHEEKRMNELRSTLVSTQPFQSDNENKFELVAARGGRGGAQMR